MSYHLVGFPRLPSSSCLSASSTNTSATPAPGRFCSPLPRRCARCWRPTCPWFSLQTRTCRQPFTTSPARPLPCVTLVRNNCIEQNFRWNTAHLERFFHAYISASNEEPLKDLMFGRVMWWIPVNCSRSALGLPGTVQVHTTCDGRLSSVSVIRQLRLCSQGRFSLSLFLFYVKFQYTGPSVMCSSSTYRWNSCTCTNNLVDTPEEDTYLWW